MYIYIYFDSCFYSQELKNVTHWRLETCIRHLRDLTPFVQIKKCEKHPWTSVTFSKFQSETCNLTKSNTLPWMSSTFLNCTNGTKSRKTTYTTHTTSESKPLVSCLFMIIILYTSSQEIKTYIRENDEAKRYEKQLIRKLNWPESKKQ